MRMRDDMMELLQQQLVDVADMDLDAVIAGSLSKAKSTGQVGRGGVLQQHHGCFAALFPNCFCF